MIPYKARVGLNRVLKVFNAFVELARSDQTRTINEMHRRRVWIDLQCALVRGKGFVESPEHHQALAVPPMQFEVLRIYLYPASHMPFGGDEIIVEHVLITERSVSLGKSIVECKGSVHILYCFLSLTVAVVVGQPNVTKRKIRVLFDCLSKIIRRFLKFLSGPLVPIETSLQIQAICLRVVRIFFCEFLIAATLGC